MPRVCFNGNDGNYLPHKRKTYVKYCNSIGLVAVGEHSYTKFNSSTAHNGDIARKLQKIVNYGSNYKIKQRAI